LITSTTRAVIIRPYSKCSLMRGEISFVMLARDNMYVYNSIIEFNLEELVLNISRHVAKTGT
jgi:hypothetical protein